MRGFQTKKKSSQLDGGGGSSSNWQLRSNEKKHSKGHNMKQNKKKMSVRLPFLVVNSSSLNPSSPQNFKTNIDMSLKPMSTTPATIPSSTMNMNLSPPLMTPSAASASCYVDLDSSVDSDGDASCVPAEIDAKVQSMLSPFSNSQQCLFKEEGPKYGDVDGRVDIDDASSEEDETDNEGHSRSNPYVDREAESSTIDRSNVNAGMKPSFHERIGIAKQSYKTSQTYSDVSPILNLRNLEQYSNANNNPQYQQDQVYQQKLQETCTPKNYGNYSQHGHGQQGQGHEGQGGYEYGGNLGISSFSSTSSPYENSHGGVNTLHSHMHQPIIQQGPAVHMSRVSSSSNDSNSKSNSLEYALHNDRFITPGHAFVKKTRSLPRNVAPEKGPGLGITPPPRQTRSSRVLVPHVSPPSNDKYTIFILAIQPTAKKFELIRVNYCNATATIGDLLEQIPENVTEEDLKRQNYTGLCRPHGRSTASRSLTNTEMTASLMVRDGTDARILCGEVLVAIPQGYTGKEIQILSQHILRIPKMKRLLQKSDPLSPSQLKASSSESTSGRRKSRRSNRSPVSSLGIQPMCKSENNTSIGTFSSSVLFAPLSTAIHEEVAIEKQKCDIDAPVSTSNSTGTGMSRKDAPHQRYAYNASPPSTGTRTMNDAVFVQSDASSIGPSVTEMLSNPMMDAGSDTLSFSRNPPRTNQTRSRVSDNNPEDTQGYGVTAEQLELIKREAIMAAKVAAEEAFAMRMEELVGTLNISSDQKSRILEDPPDDLSYYSSFSWTGFGPSPPTLTDTSNLPASINLDHKSPAMSTITGAGVTPSPMIGKTISKLKVETPLLVASLANASICTPTTMTRPQDRTIASDESEPASPIPIDPEAQSSKSPHFLEIDDLIEDFDAELISSTMDGFFAVAMQSVSQFVEKRKHHLRQLPDEVMKRKMALKAMSLASIMFLSSTIMHSQGEDSEDESGEEVFNSSSPSTADKPFSMTDLQQVLFWFMFMIQGQNYVTKHKSRSKRKSRTWKSRVKAMR